jgi:hypothetical protein
MPEQLCPEKVSLSATSAKSTQFSQSGDSRSDRLSQNSPYVREAQEGAHSLDNKDGQCFNGCTLTIWRELGGDLQNCRSRSQNLLREMGQLSFPAQPRTFYRTRRQRYHEACGRNWKIMGANCANYGDKKDEQTGQESISVVDEATDRESDERTDGIDFERLESHN